MGIFDDKNYINEAIKGFQNELISYLAEERYNQENGIIVQPENLGTVPKLRHLQDEDILNFLNMTM